MSGYHHTLLGYCLEGVGLVVTLFAGLIICLMLGCVFGLLIVHHHFFDAPMFYGLLWFGVAVVGIMQVWGLLSYLVIGFEAVALFRIDSHRWLVLLAILLIQTCETTRMLLYRQDSSLWLQALAILGVLLFPILHLVIYRCIERGGGEQEAPYTDCRNCGYNLTGSLAARCKSCPECGEPISQYQLIRSVAEQRSLQGSSKLPD